MRKSRFTNSQIMAVLKRAEGGELVPVTQPSGACEGVVQMQAIHRNPMR
jgi:hypothetical protein